jgi:hypothetical protein
VIVPVTDDSDIYLLPVAECFCQIAIDRGKPTGVDDITETMMLWCAT